MNDAIYSSRERILRAIEHKMPDRIPVDFGGTRATSITMGAYLRLNQYLGIDETPKVFDMKLALCEVGPQLQDLFHPDTAPVFRMYPALGLSNATYKNWPTPDGVVLVPQDYNPQKDGRGNDILQDAAGEVIATRPEGTPFYEISGHAPLAQYETAEEMQSYDFDAFKMGDEEIECMYQRAQAAHLTGRAVILVIWCNIFERCNAVRGMQNFMMDLAMQDGTGDFIMDQIMARYIDGIQRILARVGNLVDVVALSDDMGTQTSLLISRDMYRQQIKPRHKTLVELVKRLCRAKVFFHSCGAIEPLIGDLIEIGVDAINPVQFSATGMDLAFLKKEYGNDITFWGGTCDSQKVLPCGTPEEVYEHTARNVEILSKGGGFVFCPLHNIQHDVPPENILALFRAAQISL